MLLQTAKARLSVFLSRPPANNQMNLARATIAQPDKAGTQMSI